MASPRTQRTHTDAFVCNISHTFLHCICKMEGLARPTPQKWCYNFERKLTRALSISCSIKTKHIYHRTYVPSFIHINFYFLYAVRAHKHSLASQAGFRCGHKSSEWKTMIPAAITQTGGWKRVGEFEGLKSRRVTREVASKRLPSLPVSIKAIDECLPCHWVQHMPGCQQQWQIHHF